MEYEEAHLFKLVQERAEKRDVIRVVPLGNQIGLHPMTTREFARKWKNSGLVDFAEPNRIWLTKNGKEFNPYGSL